jgi:hypothetical protein
MTEAQSLCCPIFFSFSNFLIGIYLDFDSCHLVLINVDPCN